jgi:photosystem II stability/assembly factor-like uncharacterized protein
MPDGHTRTFWTIGAAAAAAVTWMLALATPNATAQPTTGDARAVQEGLTQVSTELRRLSERLAALGRAVEAGATAGTAAADAPAVREGRPAMRGSSWGERCCAQLTTEARISISALHQHIRAIETARGQPEGGQRARLTAELSSHAARLDRELDALTRAADVHDARTAVMHLVAITRAIEQTLARGDRCCGMLPGGTTEPRMAVTRTAPDRGGRMRATERRGWNATLMAIAGTLLASDVAAQGAAVAPRWTESIPRSYIQGTLRGGELRSVAFLTRHVGWAVGALSDSTMIFRTADGGESWERIPMLDGGGREMFDRVRFADAKHGWIAGRKRVLHTSDGGETWAPTTDPSEGRGIWANDLLVLGPDAVVIGAADQKLFITGDGGRSWTRARIPDARGDVVALGVVPPGQLFAVTSTGYHPGEGAIYRSRDGGATWELKASSDAGLLALHFFDERRGVATGVGVAYWTADGGESWSRVIAPGKRFAVRFLDEQTVVSVGERPSVVMSRNGGRTWAPIAGPETRGRLVDVAAVDHGWWFAAGGYGANALFRYHDPSHSAAIAEGTLPLPWRAKLPGGRELAPGSYQITLAHRADEHVLTLAPIADSARRAASDAAVVSVEAQYTAVNEQSDAAEPVSSGASAERRDRSRARISLEPTATGGVIVLDALVSLPRDVRVALAALGAGQGIDANVAMAGDSGSRLSDAAGRARQAAAGDVRGALQGAGVNPLVMSQRASAARSASLTPYRIRLRYPIQLIKAPGQ